MLYMKVIKRGNPEFSSQRKNFIRISLILHLYEMMYVHQTYCNNHFMKYGGQIIMLYTLNLYSTMSILSQ